MIGAGTVGNGASVDMTVMPPKLMSAAAAAMTIAGRPGAGWALTTTAPGVATAGAACAGAAAAMIGAGTVHSGTALSSSTGPGAGPVDGAGAELSAPRLTMGRV
jgi:hypothetical protein